MCVSYCLKLRGCISDNGGIPFHLHKNRTHLCVYPLQECWAASIGTRLFLPYPQKPSRYEKDTNRVRFLGSTERNRGQHPKDNAAAPMSPRNRLLILGANFDGVGARFFKQETVTKSADPHELHLPYLSHKTKSGIQQGQSDTATQATLLRTVSIPGHCTLRSSFHFTTSTTRSIKNSRTDPRGPRAFYLYPAAATRPLALLQADFR